MHSVLPLAQGMLTDKYLHGVPSDSRAAKETGFLQPNALTAERLEQIRALNMLATERDQTLAQMALQWVQIPIRPGGQSIGVKKFGAAASRWTSPS